MVGAAEESPAKLQVLAKVDRAIMVLADDVLETVTFSPWIPPNNRDWEDAINDARIKLASEMVDYQRTFLSFWEVCQGFAEGVVHSLLKRGESS